MTELSHKWRRQTRNRKPCPDKCDREQGFPDCLSGYGEEARCPTLRGPTSAAHRFADHLASNFQPTTHPKNAMGLPTITLFPAIRHRQSVSSPERATAGVHPKTARV